MVYHCAMEADYCYCHKICFQNRMWWVDKFLLLSLWTDLWSHKPIFNMVLIFSLPSVIFFFLIFVKVWWVGTAQSVGNQGLHHWDYVLGYPTTLRSIPILHQALVLCPSCGPLKLVWIKHDIPIINKGRGKGLAYQSTASQRAFNWKWEVIN